MKELPLTNGGVALVDDQDYDLVSRNSWYQWRHGGIAYAARSISASSGRKTVLLMHRYLLGIQSGQGRGTCVEHRDKNGLNNQRANLRICHQRDAVRNQRMRAGAKSSRFRGVYWHKKDRKWAAGIKLQCKTQHLGRFESEEAAAAAYDAAATKYFGEFARLNGNCA